ncbi:MAG TPA: Uma2 family endonuclease [Bryobacteraceae bacterium]|nr:Uma2 family endonuclease [Bryobacteraceae bacterium]
MSAHQQTRLTPQEYLELERASEFKHEYFNGYMYPLGGYAMAGGSSNQAIICSNLIRELGTSLKKRPCIVTGSDLRVGVTADGPYTYPDVTVVCGEPKYADSRRDTLLNPVLIIEVLSPSTEARDRGIKATQYRTMTSLQEYALVWQGEARIELFRRQPGGPWLLSETVGLEGVCRFESVDCSVALSDVYDKVTFDPDAPPVSSAEAS